MPSVFLVMGEFGEYEQRMELVVGVFSSKLLAGAALAQRKSNATAYQKAWDEWCAKGGSKSGIPAPECKTPGECIGDYFSLVEIPLDVAGDYNLDYN